MDGLPSLLHYQLLVTDVFPRVYVERGRGEGVHQVLEVLGVGRVGVRHVVYLPRAVVLDQFQQLLLKPSVIGDRVEPHLHVVPHRQVGRHLVRVAGVVLSVRPVLELGLRYEVGLRPNVARDQPYIRAPPVEQQYQLPHLRLVGHVVGYVPVDLHLHREERGHLVGLLVVVQGGEARVVVLLSEVHVDVDPLAVVGRHDVGLREKALPVRVVVYANVDQFGFEGLFVSAPHSVRQLLPEPFGLARLNLAAHVGQGERQVLLVELPYGHGNHLHEISVLVQEVLDGEPVGLVYLPRYGRVNLVHYERLYLPVAYEYRKLLLAVLLRVGLVYGGLHDDGVAVLLGLLKLQGHEGGAGRRLM